MTKQDTAKILAYFRELYPNGAKVTADTVSAWHTIIGEYEYRVAWDCAVSLAKEWEGYTMPPAAALARKIRSVMPEDKTAVELWREAEKLIRKGTILTEEEFNQASTPIRKYFGGKSAIRDLAMLDIDELPNERARFLRNIQPIIEREAAIAGLSSESRNLLADISAKLLGG